MLKMKKNNFITRVTLLLHILLLLLTQVNAGQCFKDSNFPKVLASKEDLSNRGESKYFAITGNETTIYLGGWTEDSNIGPSTLDGAVITRIEL